MKEENLEKPQLGGKGAKKDGAKKVRFGAVCSFFSKIIKWLLLALVIFIVSLFFRDQKLPKCWVEKIAQSLSSNDIIVKCDGAALGFRRGITLSGVSICDAALPSEPKCIASASSISADLIRNVVTVTGANYPRLPDSYYESGYAESNSPVSMVLPDLPNLRLVLVNPNILGLRPGRVTAQVDVSPNLIALDEIHVEWPGNGRRIAEDGYFRIDLAEQRAHGEVRGLATQRHIRPLLVALDIPSAMPYFDAFTEVPSPVSAIGEFDVNLVNNDFKMLLDLRPEMGKYNGVKMSRAEGKLDLDVKTRGTNCLVRFAVDLPMAVDPKGRQLSGSIAVNLTNEFARLDYNASSRLDFVDILRIADFISPDTLDFIVCDTAPEITAVGHTGTCVEDSGWNDLAGSARVWRGSVFGFKVRNMTLDYSLLRDTLKLTNVRATGKSGGAVQGEVTVEMPDFDEDRMSFFAKCALVGGSLEELADVFDLDIAGRDGKLDADVELSGPISTNALAHLNGRGTVRVTDGHLLQMQLFAGLTKLISDWVPGVGYIVNQSQASLDFSIEDGIFKTENFFIEGGLISIKGWGTYDIDQDYLDFTVRVQFLKNESILGKIVHPVTWPFTKLLLEFKAKGSIKDPGWQYISMLDRVF